MGADAHVAASAGAPAVGAGTSKAAGAAGIVLMTLAAGQFVMALDTTVMNTAIATVAKDVGTTVTGIQTAITLYTLVMASLMITGGKVGQMIGRKRAFAIGCIIYACGSLTTALSQNLAVLMFGWSGLEGLGGGADHAGDCGAGRVELHKARSSARVWARRRCGRDRGGAGAARRRPVHHVRIVAVGVRRGGADRAGDPLADSPHEGHAGGGRRQTRPGGHGIVRARARCDRARHPEGGDVGARAAQAGRSRVVRALPGDLADPRRRRDPGPGSCGGRTGGSRAATAR